MTLRVDTPAAFCEARRALDLTEAEVAEILRLDAQGESMVRQWENGEIPITGPAQIVMETLLRERFGPVLDLPPHDPDARNVPDQTPARAHYVCILDNLDRPDVVKRHAEMWWEKHRDLLNALLSAPQRLTLEQYLALDRCCP